MADVIVSLVAVTPNVSKVSGKQVERVPGLSPAVKDGVWAERSVAYGGYVRATLQASLDSYIWGEVLKLSSLNANIIQSLPEGVVSYWKLDGNSNDAVGSNNGTNTGITFPAGKLNQAAAFLPASTSQIDCGASSTLEVQSNSFTLAAWVNPTNYTSTYQAWILRDQGGQPQYRLGHQATTGVWGFTFYNGTVYRDYWVPSPATIPTGTWTHVAFVYDFVADTYTFYKNGVSVYAPTGVLNDFLTGAGTFYIGRNITNATYFTGSIDEVGVWNRALPAHDIEDLYNRTVGQQYPFGLTAPTTTGLLGYWKLDGNSTDSLGAANGTDTAITYAAAKVNQGAVFNGTTGVINTGSGVPMDSNNWSLSVWLNPTTTQTGRFLTYYGSGPTLQYSSGNVALVHAGTLDWNPGIPVPLATWTHLVLTRVGGLVIVYKDGVELARNASFVATYTKDTTLRFGNSPYTSEPFNGMLDEIGIWSRALTADEVRDLYNSGVGKQYPF